MAVGNRRAGKARKGKSQKKAGQRTSKGRTGVSRSRRERSGRAKAPAAEPAKRRIRAKPDRRHGSDPAQTVLTLVQGGATAHDSAAPARRRAERPHDRVQARAKQRRGRQDPTRRAVVLKAPRGRKATQLQPDAEKQAAPIPSAAKRGVGAPSASGVDIEDLPPATRSEPEVGTAPGPTPLGDQAILTAAETAGRRVRTGRAPVKQTAVQLGAQQRAISVSEFFTKNRHLLGFDNPAKALLTAVKEAVDNSIDACEEAGILPDVVVRVKQLAEDRFRIIAQDNGPGIIRSQIPRIFGSLLYGSKFHTLKQARGQQGLGISAAGMYGQLTTGKPIVITSRTGPRRPSHYYEIQIDTKKNAPTVISEGEVDWDVPHGTRVEIELEATYKKGKHSVDGYLEQTALANPHASIVYYPPKDGPVRFERVSSELPKQPLGIRPHPHGVEFGILVRMLRESKARNLKSFLQSEFSRVSAKVADEICEKAGLPLKAKPSKMSQGAADALYKAIAQVKIMNPPTNCLSPVGEELIVQGLKKQVGAEFYTAVTRSPAVYRGNPFLIEAGVAYGGPDMAQDELVTMLRYANRVPLLYQQSACAITKSLIQTSWKKYGLAQSKGTLPTGPALVMVHIASAWVPFTSESKEAIAHYPEIVKEIKLAVQECGRKLGAHIRRRIKQAEAEKKRSYIERYIPHIGVALRDILGLSDRQERKVVDTLKDTLEKSRKL